MKVFASTGTRIFLICWIIYSMYFATNVVREHYPAFSLIESGTFKVDAYADYHPDIFKHRDGHWYIGNNVAGSVIAAIPLLVFDPVLDMIEKYEKKKLKEHGPPATEYRTTHKNSKIFMQLVREAGLSLRFGAATVVTSVFLMAPLSALMVLLMYRVLRARDVTRRSAWWLSLVFAFSTPMFFRTGVLNHNVMLMYVTFIAFLLLWDRKEEGWPVTWKRRFWAGVLCGFGLALDYSGIVPLMVFYAYLVLARMRTTTITQSIRESIPYILGSIPPVLYLLYTQWAMFGNPFLPGQYWMPDASATPFDPNFVNPYSTEGFRGFTLPSLDLYFLNLFSPTYGMYVYGPLLMLGLIPVYFYRNRNFVLPENERIFVFVYFFAFLTFCAANQYSRIQFNSGFRYMVPLVPLIYLYIADHLVRLPRKWLLVILIPVTAHSWVISMVREPPFESWEVVLEHGWQLPWLSVLKASSDPNNPILSNPFLPTLVMAFGFGLVGIVVWLGRVAERKYAPAGEKVPG